MGVELCRLDRQPPARRRELCTILRNGRRIREAKVGLAQQDAAVVPSVADIDLHPIDSRPRNALVRRRARIERIPNDLIVVLGRNDLAILWLLETHDWLRG